MEVEQAIDITAEERETVLSLLEQYLPGTAAWVYGSRAKWTARPQSDLDLVVFATPGQRQRVGDLREAFEESNLTFRVDLFVWDEVPESFRPQIEVEHLVLVRDGSPMSFDILPPGWERSTLGAACERGGGNIQTGPFGSQLHASDYRPFGVPSIMPKNIGDNRVIEDGIARIGEGDARRLARYLVRPGDIVYSRRGDVERRALIGHREDGWLCGTGCLRVRLGENGVNSQYASYYLGHPVVREWIVRHAHGATMPNLNTAILSACPFLIPPLSEQRAIAHVLGTLDDKIELNRRMNETLEAMARALFKSWFVDFDPVRAKVEGRESGLPKEVAELFPDRLVDSELGEIPAGWETWRLEELSECHRRTIEPNAHPQLEFELFSIPAHDGGKLPIREKGKDIRSIKTLVPRGAVLLSKLNPEIPRTWMVAGGCDSQQVCSTEFLVFTASDQTNRSLLYSLFTDAGFRKMLQSMVTGTSKSHQRVPVNALMKRVVLAGTPALFRSFGELVGPILLKTLASRSQSSNLATLRNTLLPKLVAGEIRMHEVEGWVAESS